MTKQQLTIELSKEEARLCRSAAKAEGSSILPSHGEQTLERSEWWDMQRWLTFAALDWEVRRELNTRKAMEKLSTRIEAVIERFDIANPIEPEKPEPQVKQKALF